MMNEFTNLIPENALSIEGYEVEFFYQHEELLTIGANNLRMVIYRN